MTPIWYTYKIPIILGVVSILLIIVSIVLLLKSVQTVTPVEFSISTQSGQIDNLASISVDVEGAVVTAGVISLPSGSRVEDAIEAAGGLRNNADTQYISKNLNRAMKLFDGMKIYIPEANEGDTSHNLSTNNNLVSINLATKEQLESLSGVGPATAQKIIDSRPYASLSDLITKKAIGSSLLEKLKNQLSL